MEAKGGNGAFRKEEGQIWRHWKQSLQRTLSFGLGLMLRGAPAKKEYRSCPPKEKEGEWTAGSEERRKEACP